jgi:hypothetical protein
MKSMHDRKMDMKRGEPKSDRFFPEEAEMHVMKRAGEIKGFKYPDFEEAIHRDQEQAVDATSRNMPKPEFRH